jgi:hypothetical protein
MHSHAKLQIRIATLSAALMLPATAAWSQAADMPAKAGTMKLVQGDVRVTDASGERVLRPGDNVAPADRLVTGADGAASLVLRDGTTMMLGPRSRVNIDAFTFNSTTQEGSLAVAVVRGTMRMISGLIAKTNPRAVGVTTRTATIGVRGTDFIVEVDETAE